VGLTRRWRLIMQALLACMTCVLMSWAHADMALTFLKAQKLEDASVQLSYQTRLELPKAVEDAVLKGVPIFFTAEVHLFRSRWYWRDKRLGHASQTWRLAYQPLTRRYRLSAGSYSQSFEQLHEALAQIAAVSRWKVGEGLSAEDEGKSYVEFNLRLDTSQLPVPFQIGIEGQNDWQMKIEKTVKVEDGR
jgi:hypothetical protein